MPRATYSIADSANNVIRETTPAVTVTIFTNDFTVAHRADRLDRLDGLGESVTFTATVSDLSAGGARPDGGTVTFSDQNG